jgi:glycosyltransferase involved in cell wall biosynthesis
LSATSSIQTQKHIKQNSSIRGWHPLVTVVIPTYNRFVLLQQAITSVVTQTYTNWELIIVDDGSDDGTSEAIISMKDNRIKVLKLRHIGNIAILRNIGVKSGSGEWLSFLDSDDIWIPQRLEILLSILFQKGKRWGYGGFELMNKDTYAIPNKAGKYRPISGWIVKDVITTEASVNIGALMLERTLFEEVGGFNEDTKLIYREDYELVIRLALKSEALAIPDLLVRVRDHEGRVTNGFEYGHDRTAAVYKHFILSRPGNELVKIARRRMACELAESAIKSMEKKQYLQATRQLGKALFNGDNLRHLLSVVRRGIYAYYPAIILFLAI